MEQLPPPAWLETDWVLGQFGQERAQAQGRYAAFVGEGIGLPSVWDELRHQVFLGSEEFAEHQCGASIPLEQLRKIPRAQRRPLAKSLARLASEYPLRHEAMARAFLTGAYTMREIADYFAVHYSTVSRAVRWLEASADRDSAPEVRSRDA